MRICAQGAAHGVWKERTTSVEGVREERCDVKSPSDVISLRVDIVGGRVWRRVSVDGGDGGVLKVEYYERLGFHDRELAESYGMERRYSSNVNEFSAGEDNDRIR